MTISLSTEFENLCLIDSFKKRVKTKNIGICTEFINKLNILNEKNSKKFSARSSEYFFKRHTLKLDGIRL